MTRIFLITVIACTLISSANAQDAQKGWLLFRGDLGRTGAASTLPKWPKRSAWERPLLMDEVVDRDGFKQADPDGAVDGLLSELRKDTPGPDMPGSFPLIVNDRCFYRTFRDLRSVALQPISRKDEDGEVVAKVAPGDIVWKGLPLARSLAVLLETKTTRYVMPEYVHDLKSRKVHQWTWANPMIGVLSADEQTVYAVDDFPFSMDFPFRNPREEKYKHTNALAGGNAMFAYDAATGKLKWDLTGAEVDDPEVRGGFFLGAPLPWKGKLYVLHEKAGALRLIVLNPHPKEKRADSRPVVEIVETIMAIPLDDRITYQRNRIRRTQPLQLAGQSGGLVCQTHLGVIFGLSGWTESWQYRYREIKRDPLEIQPQLPYWAAACPIVHKDNIVFTAADSPDIHCIDGSGKKRWSVKRDENDLYVAAVTDEIVLVIGKSHGRALSLKDGSVKWKLELGSPAGVGVKDGSLYYVPLKRDSVTEGATIWGIDLTTGRKARRIQVPYPNALGNLALYRGLVVSQSATHVAAFPLGADFN